MYDNWSFWFNKMKGIWSLKNVDLWKNFPELAWTCYQFKQGHWVIIMHFKIFVDIFKTYIYSHLLLAWVNNAYFLKSRQVYPKYLKNFILLLLTGFVFFFWRLIIDTIEAAMKIFIHFYFIYYYFLLLLIFWDE